MNTHEKACRARIVQLLGLDPQKPQVGAATLTGLAREFAAGRVIDNADVLAERADCAATMQACRDRLARQFDRLTLSAADDAALEDELRRFDTAISGVKAGLHPVMAQRDQLCREGED